MAGEVVQQVSFWAAHGSDVAIVAATFLGPIAAVQAQKLVERHRTVKDRRSLIFRTLMSTRAARLSPGHVEALNAVPVEFYGRGRKLKEIRDEWQGYFDALNNKELVGDVLAEKRNNAFINMLHKMSTFIGYDFSRSDLLKFYYPEGHALIEADQDAIRRGFAQLLRGEIAIPMAVKEFPGDDEAAKEVRVLHHLLIHWLEGARAVKVEQS